MPFANYLRKLLRKKGVQRLQKLNDEKIRRLEQEKDKQRKEINRQARRIKELEKKLNEKEKATDE